MFIEPTDIEEQHLDEDHTEYNAISSKFKYHRESSLLYFPQAEDDLAEIEADLLSVLAFRRDGKNEEASIVRTNSNCIISGK